MRWYHRLLASKRLPRPHSKGTLIIAGVGFLIGLILVGVRYGDSAGCASGRDVVAMRGVVYMGHLYGSNRVWQEFTCSHDGLARVDLILRPQPGGKVTVTLEETRPTPGVVWEADVQPAEAGAARHTIAFSPLDSGGRSYRLTVAAAGQPARERMAVGVTAVDVYPEASMYLNEWPTSVDMAFQFYYRPPSLPARVALTLQEVTYWEALLRRMAQYKPDWYKGAFPAVLLALTSVLIWSLVSISTEQATRLPPVRTWVHIARGVLLTAATAAILVGLTVWALRPPPAAAVTVAQGAPTAGENEQAEGGERVAYDLVLALERGEARLQYPPITPLRTWVVPTELALKDWRPAIRMRLSPSAAFPVSSASFDVRLPQQASLTFATALSSKETSAAIFTVTVDRTVVFERIVNPDETPRPDRWEDHTVDLSPWGERQVEITLAVRPSVEGEGEGHVGWGMPAVVTSK